MFRRPTLKELIKRISDDTQSRLKVPQLRRSNAAVYSRVVAGASHSLHGYIEWLSKQLFVDSADREFLDRWAAIYAIYRKPAEKATGKLKFTFSGNPVDVPIGTLLQSDAGVQYETTSGVDSDAQCNVVALIAGENANVEPGDELMLTSPLAGVLSRVQVVSLTGGADAEDDESLRTRLLFRMREQPHGGAKADYEQWTLAVPGVTRAWCYPTEDGVGTVTVRFVCDNNSSIIPDEEMIQKVIKHLDERRPVTAQLSVKAPVMKAVKLTIDALTPDTSDVRKAVEQELRDLFVREAEPGSTVLISHVRAAISYALGEVDHKLISPTEDIAARKGELLTLGKITWQ